VHRVGLEGLTGLADGGDVVHVDDEGGHRGLLLRMTSAEACGRTLCERDRIAVQPDFRLQPSL
jgi:hypothetical protein